MWRAFVAAACMLSSCYFDYGLMELGDAYFFLPGSKVDVIMIIDGSGSMHYSHSKLRRSLLKVPLKLSERDLDWRLVISSSSPEYDTWEEVEYERDSLELSLNMIEAMDHVKMTGGGYEEPFDTIHQRLDDHGDWLRSDATTLYIIATDEPDQSDIDADEFLLGLPGMFYILAIAGEPGEDTYIEYEGSEPPFCFAEASPEIFSVGNINLNICREQEWNIAELLP